MLLRSLAQPFLQAPTTFTPPLTMAFLAFFAEALAFFVVTLTCSWNSAIIFLWIRYAINRIQGKTKQATYVQFGRAASIYEALVLYLYYEYVCVWFIDSMIDQVFVGYRFLRLTLNFAHLKASTLAVFSFGNFYRILRRGTLDGTAKKKTWTRHKCNMTFSNWSPIMYDFQAAFNFSFIGQNKFCSFFVCLFRFNVALVLLEMNIMVWYSLLIWCNKNWIILFSYFNFFLIYPFTLKGTYPKSYISMDIYHSTALFINFNIVLLIVSLKKTHCSIN